jgi:hypothetical protein
MEPNAPFIGKMLPCSKFQRISAPIGGESAQIPVFGQDLKAAASEWQGTSLAHAESDSAATAWSP